MKNKMSITSWYSRIPTKLWIDIWCAVALVRFTLGKPIDSTTFLGILGIYATHQVGTKIVTKGNSNVN